MFCAEAQIKHFILLLIGRGVWRRELVPFDLLLLFRLIVSLQWANMCMRTCLHACTLRDFVRLQVSEMITV